MQRSTFKVLFYVKRQSEKSGPGSVMGRITVNGTMSQFSCTLTVRLSLLDANANKAAGKDSKPGGALYYNKEKADRNEADVRP